MKTRWRAYRRGEPSPLGKVVLRVVMIVSVATMILPFLWMISTALKDEASFQRNPSSWIPVIPPHRTVGSVAIDYVRATTQDFEDVLLADFEAPADQLPTAPRAARAGNAGLLLRYDFSRKSAPAKAASMPPHAIEQGRAASSAVRVPIQATCPPEKLSTLIVFWLKGDGSGHKLDLDVRGDGFEYKSAEPLRLTFEGWKEVYCLLRPEVFDPMGRVIVQMKSLAGEPRPIWPGAIRAIDFDIAPVSRAEQVFCRLTDSFVKAWASMPFGRAYLNTLLIAIAVTIGQTLTSSLAAYAFSRLEFPGRDKIFLGYLGTMMIPGAVQLVPTFLLIRWLDWFDSYKAMIIPAMFSAYGTFMLRQFFMTLPRDLEDAARIDGCGKLRVWYHVIMPLSKPALATLATFTFLGTWESFQWPLFVTKSLDMNVLPVLLSRFQDKFDVQYNLLMAAALITTIPTLLVFLFNQRFFTKGIVMTGMKD